MDEAEEIWVSSKEALVLLSKDNAAKKVPKTICDYAGARLIKSRAERLIKDGKTQESVEIPRKVWDAIGIHALEHDWDLGRFEVKILDEDTSSENWKVLNAQFLHSDIKKFLVNVKKSNTGNKKSDRWVDWVAELVLYFYENGIPDGQGHAGQSEIIEDVELKLYTRNIEPLSRAAVQPTVNAVLDRIREENKAKD